MTQALKSSAQMLEWRRKRLSNYLQRFGMLNGFNFFLKLNFHPILKYEKIEPLTLPSYPSPIYLRLKTSDIPVFEEVLVNEEYDLSFLNLNPKIIVDAGANIGLSSIFFALAFPHARIFAIEPEESNFQMLVKNTQFYHRILPIHAALWNRQEHLQITNSKDHKWAFQVTESKENKPTETVRGLSVDELLGEAEINQIDIMKIDIECAEKELFDSNYENWLDKTKLIIIELHDRLREGCSESFYKAANHFDFQKIERKDHVILLKKPLANKRAS